MSFFNNRSRFPQRPRPLSLGEAEERPCEIVRINYMAVPKNSCGLIRRSFNPRQLLGGGLREGRHLPTAFLKRDSIQLLSGKRSPGL
jgi:hypothetical protein